MTEKDFLAAYDAHADAIFRRCLFKVSDREAALELSQEVFTRVWEYVQEGNSIENMKAFLFRTTNNLIIDHYKKSRPLYEHDMSEESAAMLCEIPDTSRTDMHAEMEMVMRCVRKLPERERDIVLMHYTEGLPIQEIAEAIDEKPNSVSVWLKRSLEALRNCLRLSPKLT